MITITRYHDISCGHRVVGHESKCKNLHGHNYRIYFTLEPYPIHELDKIGRVVDFSVIKSKLCEWLEKNWDHKFLVWEKDPLAILSSSGAILQGRKPFSQKGWKVVEDFTESFVAVPFNPTAEEMARYLVTTVGPALLENTGTRLKEVIVEETRKCSATYGI